MAGHPDNQPAIHGDLRLPAYTCSDDWAPLGDDCRSEDSVELQPPANARHQTGHSSEPHAEIQRARTLHPVFADDELFLHTLKFVHCLPAYLPCRCTLCNSPHADDCGDDWTPIGDDCRSEYSVEMQPPPQLHGYDCVRLELASVPDDPAAQYRSANAARHRLSLLKVLNMQPGFLPLVRCIFLIVQYIYILLNRVMLWLQVERYLAGLSTVPGPSDPHYALFMGLTARFETFNLDSLACTPRTPDGRVLMITDMAEHQPAIHGDLRLPAYTCGDDWTPLQPRHSSEPHAEIACLPVLPLHSMQ
jgi:hypothetical protein